MIHDQYKLQKQIFKLYVKESGNHPRIPEEQNPTADSKSKNRSMINLKLKEISLP